jgi:hypothetical protein
VGSAKRDLQGIRLFVWLFVGASRRIHVVAFPVPARLRHIYLSLLAKLFESEHYRVWLVTLLSNGFGI